MELFCSHSENPDKILPISDNWVLWAQYTAGMICMKQYSERSQRAQVLFHLELWWIKVYLEQLNVPFFLVADNRLIAIGDWGKYLTKLGFNHLVKKEGFNFRDDSFEDDYELVNQISDNIEVFRNDDFIILIVRMGYVKRHIDGTKTANHELDKNIDSVMMAGLTDDDKLKDVKTMCDIVHPLFQMKLRLIAAGLCTETQYEAGRSYSWI